MLAGGGGGGGRGGGDDYVEVDVHADAHADVHADVDVHVHDAAADDGRAYYYKQAWLHDHECPSVATSAVLCGRCTSSLK